MSYEQLARPQIIRSINCHERVRMRADVETQNEIGKIVLIGRLIVEDHEACADVLGKHRKPGRGPDHQRGADRDQQIATCCQRLGATHRDFRHRLAERDRRGLDRIVAGRAGRRDAARGVELLPHPVDLVALAAADAARVARIAVQFDHVVRRDTRTLMQIVDILRDHARHFSGAIQRGDGAMAASRFRRSERRLHREAPLPGFVARLLAGDELVEGNRPALASSRCRPANGSRECRIRSRCRRRGEGNDFGRLRDHLAKLFDPAAKV